VRELLVRGGDFNLKHYGKGRFNYEIWKKSDHAGALDFHLNRVLLHNSLIRYRDIVGHHDYQVLARKAVARGDLYENGQDFAMSGDIRIHSLKASDFVFMTDHKAVIDLEFSNNTSGKNFEVRKGKVSIENMTFGLEGYVHYIKRDAFLDFLFDGKNLKIEQLVALLPEEVQGRFAEYTFKGNTAFKLEVKGDYTTSSLGLYTRFSFSNGTVLHRKSGISAKNVALQGDFSNGQAHKAHSARLHLDRIYMELPGGAIDGAFSLNNFKTPEISFKGTLRADMAELQRFFGFAPDFRYEGQARAEVEFHNRFSSLSPDRWKALDFGSAKLKGFLQVDKAAVALTNRNWDRVEIDSIRISFTPEVFRIPSFPMRYGKDEIRLKVFIENALPYFLLPMQKLYVNASLSSSRIDMNQWQTLLLWGNPDSVRALRPVTEKGSRGASPQPAAKKKSSKNLFTDIYADFDVDVNRVIWKNLDVSPLKGLLRYTPEDIALENLSVGAFQGAFDGEVLYQHGGEESELRVSGKLEDMDVGACLKAFDNFGQTQITYKNLGGTLSADLRLRMNRDRDGAWKREGMVFWSELVLRNGILQNVETLKKIARFTGENDLQNIHFADLRTTLEIQNACIKIHHMDVVSDAANLTFSGTHTFDNEVNYLLNIDLSDFLSRRRAQRVKEESEFGVVVTEKSRVRLPLSIKGKLPDVEVKYAMSEAKKGAKERLQENRREFKAALDEEFSFNRQKR
ncbi:MAG: AsmA-like C-terminal region-containing protein, partial [Bacteroidales bacterium]|nr:AsmA-like C-terminal region-containing protein [Bacteroidales bacterium]